MALTFKALTGQADFSEPPLQQLPSEKPKVLEEGTLEDQGTPRDEEIARFSAEDKVKLGLVYNIQLVLPESRDPAVYDAFFQSFRKHMLR